MTTTKTNVAERALFEGTRFGVTELATSGIFASSIKSAEENAGVWDRIVDRKLIEWGTNRQDFAEEGLTAPTDRAIQKAFAVVRYMRDRDWPIPTGIIPDGEGGIAFENRSGQFYQRLEIESEGEMWLVTFRNSFLESREPVEID